MKKILIASNGSGYQIDKCLDFPLFKDAIQIIVSDRECPILNVAKKHGVEYLNLAEMDLKHLNVKILEIAKEKMIDYIISPGFTRLFTDPLLAEFENRIFNCHPSILPAFRGFYDTRDVNRKFPARKIYERTLDFGSRVTGQAHEGSDIDVLIISEFFKDIPFIKRMPKPAFCRSPHFFLSEHV